MKKTTLILFLSLMTTIGFAADENAVAYNIGKLLGNLLLVGIVVLVIWLIVRAVRRNKSK